VLAIEVHQHVSARREQALIAAGGRVVHVTPRMMGASRRSEREPGKSEQLDAPAATRAAGTALGASRPRIGITKR